MFDIQLHSQFGEAEFSPMTLRDIIFSPLNHRDENSTVICSHIGNRFLTISLKALRSITCILQKS
jgi:hypothetical protein